MNSSALIQKFWSFCNTLRDDGMGYGDYLEQLTYLLFLKLAHEYAHPPHNRDIHIPRGLDWGSLQKKDGASLERQYSLILSKLGRGDGMLGAIFYRADNKIQDPAKLSRLIQMIDAENWINLGVDLKGDLYEGLLQKNAEDMKSGAGQYFTPRALIEAIVACVRPKPMKRVADPACGTGGFFLGTYNWLVSNAKHKLTSREIDFLRNSTFFGNEIVPATRRMCLMNLFLHSIGDMVSHPKIEQRDALLSPPDEKFDYVLANPPFGKKSSITITNSEGVEDRDDLLYERPDFWETTSNKQLNFLQHIAAIMKPTGHAAVVVPDNVLYEGGAGEKIRRKLLQHCDVHTLLRLPAGIFYAGGVKANVLFFDNRPRGGKALPTGMWVYDLRTNKHFTLKTKSLKQEDLQDFINCYCPDARERRVETDRFKYFEYDFLMSRDKMNLDFFWLKDSTLTNLDELPSPEILQQEIIDHLESALNAFRDVASGLAKRHHS
jgi:type I restriction enzyme M protein